MRIKSLHLENIGPFVEVDLEFFDRDGDRPPVVLITGENGTGKSIILDAIRGLFGLHYARLERDVRRVGEVSVSASAVMAVERTNINLTTTQVHEHKFDVVQEPILHEESLWWLPFNLLEQKQNEYPEWVVDYWPSTLATGEYGVQSFQSPDHEAFLKNSLSGSKSKADITQLICHFDYLSDSRDRQERETGRLLYSVLEKLIEVSLLEGGRFSRVARTTYEPLILQNGKEVLLSQLSSGNSYLIQNLVGLLGKMYSVHFLRKTDPSELLTTPGLLLIDEAENQLHPKWQKRFISTVRSIFPNLQIIATTHSPFIISSVENAKLFVCKAKTDHCIVVDETAQYSNKPVDEILMSPLFEETQPFNAKITRLLEKHKVAVESGNVTERDEIEAELKELNPGYFAYLDLDKMLQEMNSNGPSS